MKPSKRIGVYTLRIMAPDNSSDSANQQVIDEIGGIFNTAEETINLELPDGFYAKIDDV